MLLRSMIDNGQIRGELLDIAPGASLFKPGEPNKGFYFLVKGTASVVKQGMPEQHVGPGKLLGLPDLMQEHYHYKVDFKEAAKVIFIPKEEMLHALQQHAALRFYLMQQLSQYATAKIDAYE